MKKILLSLAAILAVGGIVWGATVAFYNDTETSSGNIFTAGSIDLKVDHLKQTYNNMDCETCSLELFSSDGLNEVTEASDGAVFTGTLPKTAVLVDNPHDNWVDHDPLSYKWVWVDSSTSAHDSGNVNVEYTFERDFYWNGTAGDVTFEMALASDNGYAIYLNDVLLDDELASEFNYNATIQPLNSLETEFKDALQLGNNTLKIIVRNHALSNGNPNTNPGGLLYHLSIENEDCENDLGFQEVCRLWIAKDLEAGDTFFNFGDVKPADWGTNVISLHVSSNDAYVCLLPQVTNDENGVVDPELGAGDDAVDGPGEGELQDEIEFFGWDDNGDGVYQTTETILIPAGTSLDDIQANIISMSLPTTSTGYIGLAWCAGTQTVTGAVIDCDGNGMSNIVQTDQAMASLTAYAVQQRNNENFSCATVVLPQ